MDDLGLEQADHALGQRVVVTVADAANQTVRDGNIKAFGKAYLDVVMDEPNVIGVTVWGLHDPAPPTPSVTTNVWNQNGWLNNDSNRRRCDQDTSVALPGGWNTRPRIQHRSAPLANNLARKELWKGYWQAFKWASAENKAHRDMLRGRVI